MARQRISAGATGNIAVVPLELDASGKWQPCPRPLDAAGEPMDYPKGLKADRWRASVRATDVDGEQFQVRRWAETKTAAVKAVERAVRDHRAKLQQERDDRAKAEQIADLGDITTTIGDLIDQTMASPEVLALAPGTIANYTSVTKSIRASWLVALKPRELDVAAVRKYLSEHANAHGRSSTQAAKAILTRAMNRAVESRSMQTPFNPFSAATRAIPNVTVRPGTIDHQRTPDDQTVAAMLAALRAEPYYGPMTGARRKSAHGAAGTAPANPIDVSDILAFTFGTGCRIGEASALRWIDLHLARDRPWAEITGTVRFISKAAAEAAGLPHHGAVRQERTKTAKSDRDVPLSPALAAQLSERASVFGIDLDDPEHLARPVFPSPQRHNRFRDPNNLTKAVRAAFRAHGIDYAATHVARKAFITSMVDAGVPVSKVADSLGHTQIGTTYAYLSRGRGMDDDVRRAMEGLYGS